METGQLRVCGTRTVNGDCLFHRWIEEKGKVIGLVETKGGGLITLPWEWIYFYDSEKYFRRLSNADAEGTN